MNIIFFGNTKYSTIVQKALFEKFGLSLVITKNILTPNPVKEFAMANNIPVLTADKIGQTIINQIKNYKPDFLVVADYGLILPKALLDIPKHAPLNVHHSLLPKYRGPSPAPTAILNGEKISGVTIIKMNKKVDSGDILAQEKYELKDDETTDSLLIKLNTLGGKIIIPVIEKYKEIKEIKQDETRATFTKHLSRKDGYIDISKVKSLASRSGQKSKVKIERKIRAYYPWPGVWTLLRLKASEGQAKELRIKFLPEKKIQVEGKKPMSYKDFMNGYPEGKELLEKLQLI